MDPNLVALLAMNTAAMAKNNQAAAPIIVNNNNNNNNNNGGVGVIMQCGHAWKRNSPNTC